MSNPQAVAEFRFLSFKDGGSPSSEGWASVTAELAAATGVVGVYFGPVAEPTAPGSHVLAVHWAGYDQASAFDSDLARVAWRALFAGLVDTPRRAYAVLGEKTANVLSAPTTELFTAFGVEDGFLENVRVFSANVDAAALEGYHGSAVGEVVEAIAQDHGGEPGEAVMLVIGWDSVDKHLEEKAKPGNRMFYSLPSFR